MDDREDGLVLTYGMIYGVIRSSFDVEKHTAAQGGRKLG